MCGIAGIVGRPGADAEQLQFALERMCDALSHRGPDDWGVVALKGSVRASYSMRNGGEYKSERASGGDGKATVALGHRRLSIIDLSPGGHQPMATTDGRFWITYNGEIYNYRELRTELEGRGAVFNSQSDTEVLLRLYAEEGAGCLEKLRGMFAFAVWDEFRGELFLARDRFGIKPLYYFLDPVRGLFAFASEIQPLLTAVSSSRATDGHAEFEFLRRGSISAPRTFYRDIKALPRACTAAWDGRGLKVEKYWSLSKELGVAGAARSAADVAALMWEELVTSVKAHMVADVPVGVFLSGGLDSTAIVSAIRQFHGGHIRTFTLRFPGTAWDEGALAREAAAHFGTEHNEWAVTKEDFFGNFDRIFAGMDQPTVDGVNTYFVAEAVRQAGVKVVLSGVGGDEMLGGYASFVVVPRLARWLRASRRVPGLNLAAAGCVGMLPAGRSPKLAELLRSDDGGLAEVWDGYRALFTHEQLLRLGVSPDGAANGKTTHAAETLGDDFRTVARMEIENFMSPQLLRDSDVFTMCHGLELRTPFVDHLFLRGLLDAGRWEKNGAPSPKLALFRQLNGLIPAAHLCQKKRGFTLPFEAWLREALSGGGGNAAGEDLRRRLSARQFLRHLDDFLRGRAHWSRVWALYVLERFREPV